MCPSPEYARRKNDARSYSEIEEEVLNMPDNIKHITVTGGEPTLLGKNFFSLMASLSERQRLVPVLYLTNGRAFASYEYGRLFVANSRESDTVAIPIHASNSALHDRIAQVEGSFAQTVKGLKNIALSKACIEIRIVVSKLNAYDVKQIVQLIVGDLPRVTVVNFIALEMTGNAAKNKDDLWIGYEKAFVAVKPGIELLLKGKIEVNLYNWPLCAVERGYWGMAKQSISSYKVRFAQECEFCSVREICGGEFASNRFGNYFAVKPVGGM
jgi:His-Xaa-Ser system radical SAM maturase HxsC